VRSSPLAASPPAETVAVRVEEVRRRIAAAAPDPAAVRLVAVTKGFDPAAVGAALAAGVGDIGENYAAELLAKARAVGTGPDAGPDAVTGAPRWHYLGAVQRRRVRELAEVVDWWHTLARAVEGEAVSRRAPGATVLVEVETSGLPGRNGCPPGQVDALVRTLRTMDLDLRGLMTVAPPGGVEAARAAFRLTARLAADLGLGELSMGMSGDLEIALEEGATMVRVGQALFGARLPPPRARGAQS